MKITDSFKGKTLVITGGTGSFGSTVLKHFRSSCIDKILVSCCRNQTKMISNDMFCIYPEDIN